MSRRLLVFPLALLALALAVSATAAPKKYTFYVDGKLVASKTSSELSNWSPAGSVLMELGNFDGWVDEVVVTTGGAPGGGSTSPPGSDLVKLESGDVQMTLTGPAGKLYVIEASTDLKAWVPVSASGVSNGSTFLDPDAHNYSRRFYRMRSLN